MKRAFFVLLLAAGPMLAAQPFSIDFTDEEFHAKEWDYVRPGIRATGAFSAPVDFTFSYQFPGRGLTSGGTRTVTPAEPLEIFSILAPRDDVYSGGFTGQVYVTYTVPGTSQQVTKSAALVIEDREPAPTLAFDDVRAIESEAGDVYAVAFHMTPRASIPIHVLVEVLGGSATAGADFVLLDTAFAVPAGTTSGQVRFRVIDDGVDEGLEYFFLGCADRCQPATVTILDVPPSATIAPERVEVLVGEPVELEIVLPETKPADLDATVASSNDAIIIPAFRGAPTARIRQGLSAVVVPFITMQPGDATITATFPAWAKLVPATADVHVFPGGFSVDDDTLLLAQGEETTVTVTMDPPPPIDILLLVAAQPQGIVTTPADLHVDTSGSGTFSVKGKAAGSSRLELRSATNRLLMVLSADVAPPLAVTGIAPVSGTTSGGTKVSISGNGFNGTCSVFFGTAAATSVAVRSTSLLEASTPAHPEGVADVAVTCGEHRQTLPKAFTFNRPSRARSVRH